MFLYLHESPYQARIRESKPVPKIVKHLTLRVMYQTTYRPNVTKGCSRATWKQNASWIRCLPAFNSEQSEPRGLVSYYTRVSLLVQTKSV